MGSEKRHRLWPGHIVTFDRLDFIDALDARPALAPRDFADARERLRYWVTACGTRGDRDRPTRQAAWPGEDPAPTIQDFTFTDRDTEFVEFVIAQVRKRQEAEDEFYASLADDEGP